MKKGLKKIRLSRETLRILGNQGLSDVVGGGTTTRNPTFCDPASNCATCNDTCPVFCNGTRPPCSP
jgi:hypothetical protein